MSVRRDDLNDRAHPGVDAALVLFDADLVGHFVKLVARVKKRGTRQALRHGIAEPAGIVQWLKEAAAEMIHLGERVDFAALIQRFEDITELNRCLCWGHVPRASG